MYRRGRSGFTLIEVVFVLLFVSIAAATMFALYVNYAKENVRNEARGNFMLVASRMKSVLSDMNRIVASTSYIHFTAPITPDDVPDPTDRKSYVAKNYDDIKNDEGIEEYRLIPADEGRETAEEFWGVTKDEARFSGSFYIVLQTAKKSVSAEGIPYPYKVYTLIDLGPAYSGFKTLANDSSGSEKKFIDIFFDRGPNGFSLRAVPDKNHPDYGTVIKKVTKTADLESAELRWSEWSGRIFTISMSNADVVSSAVSKTAERMERLAKNIEDWAAIMARKAAYDALNGGNFDRDYFVTCYKDSASATDTCAIGTVETGPNTSDNVNDAKVDYSRTLITEWATLDYGEISVPDYGFFVCENDGGKCENGSKPSAMGQNNAEYTDPYPLKDGNGDSPYNAAEFSGALPFSTDSNLDDILNPGVVASFGEYPFNEFGFAVLFSSSPAVKIVNPEIGGGEEYSAYYVRNSVPLVDVPSYPPYRASLITLFPWFVGGDDCRNGSGSTVPCVSGGFGVYVRALYAHVF